MKKEYIVPEVEVLRLETVDIITTSINGGLEEDELPPIPIPTTRIYLP